MTALETSRLAIRNFQTDDWQALHEMIGQYQASDLAAYDQPWPTTAEEIQKITNWFASGDNFLAVCLKDSARFIGFVSLNPEPDPRERVFNIGYVFNFDYHGKGYASEACRAVLEHAFHSLHAEKVLTGTAAVNRASCRLLERLGFRKTGESLASFRNGPDGKPIEFIGRAYSLSKDEWDAAGKPGSAGS